MVLNLISEEEIKLRENDPICGNGKFHNDFTMKLGFLCNILIIIYDIRAEIRTKLFKI